MLHPEFLVSFALSLFGIDIRSNEISGVTIIRAKMIKTEQVLWSTGVKGHQTGTVYHVSHTTDWNHA